MNYVVYILLCADNTLYTGITNNLERRLKQHNAGKASKYTRARLPVQLFHSFEVADKSEALKEEYKIKQLSREEKLKLKCIIV
jgi:putative endonuclease